MGFFTGTQMSEQEPQYETQLNIRGEEWTKYLNYFQKAICFYLLDEVTSGKITDQQKVNEIEEKTDTYAKQYYEAVNKYRFEIFKSTALSMDEYLNFYQVYPKDGEHDEFKGIYFTGMAVSRQLVTLGLLDLNKCHLIAVLALMDYRLDKPYEISRKLLTERIKSMIDNNVLDTHLGKYGWYLIYKCLYNSVSDRANQTL